MVNVAVVEDNDTIREGLRVLINATEGYSCAGAYSECDALFKNLNIINPDVLLIDLVLPGMTGIEGIKKAKALLPDLAILVLTVYEDNDLIFDALCAGASGYLVKKTPPLKLFEAINDANQGGASMSSNIARKLVKIFRKRNRLRAKNESSLLTQGENEILSKMVEGSNFKAIADSLDISVEKVRQNFGNIYKKLHMNLNSEAISKEKTF
jgi:DNA-binding NarL/FixJ family response regulator